MSTIGSSELGRFVSGQGGLQRRAVGQPLYDGHLHAVLGVFLGSIALLPRRVERHVVHIVLLLQEGFVVVY